MAIALDLAMPRGDEDASASEFTDAKFAIPKVPRTYVQRERLDRLFTGNGPGRRGAVTICAAPIGAGKTTMLAAFAHSLPPGSTAWCTLHADDNDPFRFGLSVLEAILAARAGRAADWPLAAASPSRDPLDQALQLAGDTGGLLLVLDNVEEIRIRAVGTTLARLIHYLPSTVSVVLLAREDPDLPVRLRASAKVSEVRAADLAFTETEARELFVRHGVVVDDADLIALARWTAGSAAALKLAAGALRLGSNPRALVTEADDGDQYAFDVLLEAVLAQLGPELRRFLLEVSIVDSVNVSLAAAIAGVHDDDAARVLDTILSADLLLEPIPGRAAWYRHSALFAGLLRTKLWHERPEDVPVLYARAARWFANSAEPVAALPCAIAGNDWDLVVELVLDGWTNSTLDGTPCAFSTVPDPPPSWRERGVDFSLATSILHFERGDAAAAILDAAQPVPGRAQLVHALLAYEVARTGGSSDAVEVAADSLFRWSVQHCEPADLVNKVAGTASRARAEARLMEGDLHGAAELLEDVITFGTATGDDLMTANATASLALVKALAGRVRHAQVLIDELSAMWVIARSPSVQGMRALTQAICSYHADRLPAAQAALVDARPLLRSGVAGDTILPVVRARIAASLGDPESAGRLLDRATAGGRARLLEVLRDALGLWPGRRLSHFTGRRDTELLLSTHPYALALDDIDRAASFYAGAAPRDAWTALDHAFAIAARNGHRRLFIDSGVPLRPLLRAYIANARPFRMLASQMLERIGATDAPDERCIVETLTERELGVLRYLPTMLSNREIAAEMYFSVNTVKTHLKSIYRKLQVTRRRDAVERARALSII